MLIDSEIIDCNSNFMFILALFTLINYLKIWFRNKDDF